MNYKKIATIILISVIGIFTFAQCKKDHSCNMRLTCYYSDNGMDTTARVPFAKITLDVSKYTAGAQILPEIDTVVEVETTKDGVFEYTLSYPALLIVNATKSDTLYDEAGNVATIKKYTGTTQVQVNEGETSVKDILLVETN